jgi:hypothetical protein
MVTFIGENLLQGVAKQDCRTHIATVFPKARIIVTVPGIHSTQREAYLEHVDAQRKGDGAPPLGEAERERLLADSVDLIIKEDKVLIRPDPESMDLAFEADTVLQEVVSKRHIGFLFLSDPRVRNAISRRGEAWRIHALPRSTDEIKRLIAGARIAVGGRAIYYYNDRSGTRFLTCEAFTKLGELPDEELRRHLGEIAALVRKRNARGNLNIQPFMAQGAFSLANMTAIDWTALPPEELRRRFGECAAEFQAAVIPGFEHDDLNDATWRNRIYAALVGAGDDELTESDLLGLSAEYFMQIEWLPGARIEDGEIIFDSVSDEPSTGTDGTPCDMLVHGLICNLLQEHSDLEFINIGRLVHSLSLRATPASGRREVYLEHFREAGAAQDTLQIIRMQKWGVREHLNEGKDLLRAMIESEENTDYIMDRRLGCRQLGMNLPPSVTVRRVAERYEGSQAAARGITIRSPYFQREYVGGLASDKIPPARLRDPRFALALARLLGMAAAPNMILGRCNADGQVIFDDGDEMVIQDASGLPIDIVVADHTSTFGDYRGELDRAASAYAEAVNRRLPFVPDPAAFSKAFLDGFLARFIDIQRDYRTRQRAFDALFRHRPCDPAGNLAFRWKLVLARLARAKPDDLAAAIRAHIHLG